MPHIDINEAIVALFVLAFLGWAFTEIKQATRKGRDGDWP